MNKILLLFATLVIYGGAAVAENEPDDNNATGAVALEINGEPETGTMVALDQDHYRIENSAGYTNLRFHYQFDGSGNDYHTLRIFDENGNNLISTDTSNVPAYEFTGTIDLPRTGIPVEQGDVYIFRVECLNGAAGGARAYTLAVTGTGAPDPNAALIANLRAQIARAKLALRRSKTSQAKTRFRQKIRSLGVRLTRALNG